MREGVAVEGGRRGEGVVRVRRGDEGAMCLGQREGGLWRDGGKRGV